MIYPKLDSIYLRGTVNPRACMLALTGSKSQRYESKSAPQAVSRVGSEGTQDSAQGNPGTSGKSCPI